MQTFWDALVRRLKAWWAMDKKFRHLYGKMFGPFMFVGNPERVRKPHEVDADAKQLAELNKEWRKMLREDPWAVKLMKAHVRPLMAATGIFWLCFLKVASILPAKHPFIGIMLAVFMATIPYWFWIAKWWRRTELKVFEEFKEKFKRLSKFFHLR